MAIYLVQHGLSLSKDEDPARGLSPQGREQVQHIAGVALGYAIRVDSVVHSGKNRARETAEIYDEVLQTPAGISSSAGLGPMDEVEAVAHGLDAAGNTMIVGHLPFMERLVAYLTTGSSEFRPFKFQGGGIVCMDRDAEDQKWYIRWALMPDIS